MDITPQINQSVLDLWQNTYKSNEDVYMPMIYPPLEKDAILFLGLNPSFSEKGFKSILEGTDYRDIKPEDFYHWRNRESFNLDIAQKIEELAKLKHPYYKKWVFA